MRNPIVKCYARECPIPFQPTTTISRMNAYEEIQLTYTLPLTVPPYEALCTPTFAASLRYDAAVTVSSMDRNQSGVIDA